MQIVNKTEDGLKKDYEIKLSIDEINVAINNKLAEVAKKVRLDGFRPGKAPIETVRRLYGVSARAEALNVLVRDAVYDVFKEERVPNTLNYKTSMISDDDNGLLFSMQFETLPEFELQDFSEITVSKYVVDVEESEVDKSLREIMELSTKWIEDENKLVEKNDKISIDLSMFNSLQKRKDEHLNNLEVVVDEKSMMIDDFWKHLIGAKIGEEREFSITYPKTFKDKKLKGKSVPCKAKVLKIFKPAKHELDDAFAKTIGFEGLDAAKNWMKGAIAKKYENIAYDLMKRDLLDSVSALYDFPISDSMLAMEKVEVDQQIRAEAERIGKPFNKEVEDGCKDIAMRRVKLGFVISKVAKAKNISVTSKEFYEALREIVAMYRGKEREMWDYYSKNESARHAINVAVLESKVVDEILKTVKTAEIKCTVEELKEMDEEVFDFFKDDDTKKIDSKKVEGPKEKPGKAEHTEVKKTSGATKKKTSEEPAKAPKEVISKKAAPESKAKPTSSAEKEKKVVEKKTKK